MELLVTGATGLVGSRMLTRLVAAGYTCRGLARPGRQLPDGVRLCEGDILHPESLGAALEGVDAVIHLAASFRSGNDEETWRVNLDGTRALIEAASTRAPAARMLMASTSNVYDADGTHPGREDDEVHPSAAYPASKARAEAELRASTLNWGIVRLPFVYGDGDGHLRAAPAGLARLGFHPAQRLSMAHHADIAAAFELALTGVMDGRIVNIADEGPPTVLEIAQLVGEPYAETAEPMANPWRGHVDASLARSLGFRASVRTVHQAVQENRM